jgi:DHA2 family multidrug resistance protein
MLAYLAEGSSGLTERLNGIIAGLISRGVNSSEAARMAYKILEGQLTRQVYLLTYKDVFLLLGSFFLLCIPLVLLIKKGAGKISASDASH